MTHKEFLKKVGMEFKVARIRAGLTAIELAKMSNLDRASINCVERGAWDARITTYKRMADALRMNLKDFM